MTSESTEPTPVEERAATGPEREAEQEAEGPEPIAAPAVGAEPESQSSPSSPSSSSRSRWSAVVALLILAGILAVGGYFRFVGVDWDEGHHLHPDERFLTMVESSLTLPENLTQYFNTERSPLNPRNTGHELFVYGTLPINLVYLIANRLSQTSYGDVYLVGRKLMAVFDLLAIVLLFLLGWRLYDRRVGLLAAALAAGTAFLIQQSHFFTVDTAANFFVLLFFLAAAGMMKTGRREDIALSGLAMGLALASKFSVWPIALLGIVALVAGEYRRGSRGALKWARVVVDIGLLGVTAFLTLRIAQPDMWAGVGWTGVANVAAPDWWFLLQGLMPDALEPLLLPDPRWAENMKRVAGMVTGHGMDWPPNHQWFNRIDYWFPWVNIVRYGMGPVLGITATVAWVIAGVRLLRGDLRHLLPWAWIAFMFLYQGGMWVKTMRYFLPLYPMLILLAAWMLVAFFDWTRRDPDADPSPGSRERLRGAGERFRSPALGVAAIALVLAGTFAWGFMVSRIYTRPHSRVEGSRWIYHNVPSAFVLTAQDGDLPGPYLPVIPPGGLDYTDNTYVLEEDRRLEPTRVIVPGDAPVTVDGEQTVPGDSPVTVDGVQFAYLADPTGSGEPVDLRAWITTTPYPEADGTLTGVIAEGADAVVLPISPDPDDPHVRIDLPATELEPGGEYYLWLEIEGAPVAGRLPIVAVETSWDDHIPMGMDGYAAWDIPASSPNAEGLYGQVNLDLYDEDFADKVDRVIERLDQADYIVLTSNRVYGAIAQLPDRFPMTLGYYDRLFSEELGFEHVGDISSFPSLGPIEVNDQPADEAWHVYDHPKVDVFRKTSEFDADDLSDELMPLVEERDWQWPSDSESGLSGLLGGVMGLLPGGGDDAGGVVDERPPLESVMMSQERQAVEADAGTWSEIFDVDSFVNRNPWAAVVLWYIVLLLVALAVFPLLATALPNMPDRGWAVARTAGLLLVSWLAWVVASVTPIAHSSLLVWSSALVVAAASAAVAWRGRVWMRAWLTTRWPVLLTEETVFLVLFAVFLLIRMGNPDLWHPYYGGEKPMDLAYLNATLRTASFPPYDPWFAGGLMNYYYYGFVFVGALIQMTGIVPWVAYNLAIPTLAAMTGLGVFGVVYGWSRRSHRKRSIAATAGVLGAVLAVLAGNLYQVWFIADKMSTHGMTSLTSSIPGVQRVLQLGAGWYAVVTGDASLSVPTGHWYWNASRAIPDVPGAVQPITEFPFFTFIYADLHAHMMALPITVLALTAAVSWVLPMPRAETPRGQAWRIMRLVVAALAVGALWPANTWDYPTYGLVLAGAIGIGHWTRHGRLGWPWLRDTAITGVALLGLSLLLFWPYHHSYVQPYADFQRWQSARTPASAFMVIHFTFLFAIVSWAVYRLWADLRSPEVRRKTIRNLVVAGAGFGLAMAVLWQQSRSGMQVDLEPSPWTPLIGAVLLTLGAAVIARPQGSPSERFGGWLLLLGALLTQFVEYVVLAGDIGRMNTVFKFYIQVWVLWSVLAAVAVAWLAPATRGRTWGTWWRATMAVLVAAGLVYTVTASRAKIQDRFPAMGPLTPEERQAFDDAQGPGLSGIAYQDYVIYDDNGNHLQLSLDRDAMQWLMANVEGTPVILEGFRDAGYRWGSRYSIHTGLPTVIGWDWHQKQQRNAVGHNVVTERVDDVRTMYNTTDDQLALDLLDDYGVEYVIVGQMERAFYDQAGLDKFDRMVEDGWVDLVYSSDTDASEPAVRIYRLERPDEVGG